MNQSGQRRPTWAQIVMESACGIDQRGRRRDLLADCQRSLRLGIRVGQAPGTMSRGAQFCAWLVLHKALRP
jgi:hypothetical protein